MKRAIDKIITTMLFLVFSATVFAMAPSVEALETKLLWEKELPFAPQGMVMAAESGDMLLYSKKAREIVLFDKNGNEVFHWGPRIDRQPMGADISDDGSIILFQTSWTETYMQEKEVKAEWGEKVIHYANRKGKELWNKKFFRGVAQLSPDGSLVAVTGATPSEGPRGVIMLNAQGEEIWKYPGYSGVDVTFSPDSEYIVVDDFGNLSLISRTGELIWKKEEFCEDCYVTEGARYVFSPIDKKVFDKQGNVIFEGFAIVTMDGKKLKVLQPGKISILSLPDKTIIKEYPYAGAGFLSYDGRFLATSGQESPDNLLIIDTVNQISREIIIAGENTVPGSTKDGRYLVVVVEDKKFLFYQVY
jgi:hypothetical protein